MDLLKEIERLRNEMTLSREALGMGAAHPVQLRVLHALCNAAETAYAQRQALKSIRGEKPND